MSEVKVITTEDQAEWTPSISPWLVVLPVIFAAFMFVLDETVANVALPHMAGTFSASRDESMWILTSYLVASGIIIPTVDWFSKVLGRKNFFILSVILFTFSSFLCAISNSIEMMIFSRILQGFGGGGLLPIAQSVSLEAFPPKERGKSMAMFGIVVVLAPIIGPVIGGWITDNWSWPWIFLINIPFGFLTVGLAKAFLEEPPYAKKQKNVKIDGLGFFLLTLWLVTLQVVLDKGNNADWFHAAWIRNLAIVSIISAVLFIISQLKRKDVLLDLSIFKDRNYSIGTFIQIIMQAVLLASMAILPQFLQSLLGYDAFLSGLSMMPRGLGVMLSMVFCGTLTNVVDNRILVAIGMTLLAIAGINLGCLNLQISSMNIAIPNFIFGMGMGLAMIPIINLSVLSLKNDQMTNASGIQNLLKNIGGAIGTSLVGTMISRYSQIHQAYMVKNLHTLNDVYVQHLSATTAALSKYTHPVVAQYMAQYSIFGELRQQATLFAFMEAFRIFSLAAICIIPMLIFLRIKQKKKQNS